MLALLLLPAHACVTFAFLSPPLAAATAGNTSCTVTVDIGAATRTLGGQASGILNAINETDPPAPVLHHT